MLKNSPIALSDLRAYNRLAVAATLGITDLVENLHHNIVRMPRLFAAPSEDRARGISGLVYRSIRGVTRTVGEGVDALIGAVIPGVPEDHPADRREALRAALNGIVGDHLDATANPLGITMSLRREGRRLELHRDALAAAVPQASARIVVLAHGLCMGDRQWLRRGHDHGAALARDGGFTPVYLHYNSGLRIGRNGREFAGLLERLLREWPVPVEELVLVGYSMGGLVVRSACHEAESAGQAWLRKLGAIVFLGTPHAGSPLERHGHRLEALLGASPYTSALARLARVRSAGIVDLRHAHFIEGADHRQGPGAPRGLPDGVRCHAIAGSLTKKSGKLSDTYVGDGLVPVASALGRHTERARRLRLPRSRQWIAHGVGHLDLLNHPSVYARLRDWLV